MMKRMYKEVSRKHLIELATTTVLIEYRSSEHMLYRVYLVPSRAAGGYAITTVQLGHSDFATIIIHAHSPYIKVRVQYSVKIFANQK